jgi:hypothetical protein
MMTHIMKTLYKFFKTAEVSQQITIHQKVKVEKYNLVKSYYLMHLMQIWRLKIRLSDIIKTWIRSFTTFF